MPASHKLGEILSADANSFNLVRLLAAISVLLSHSYSMVTGIVSDEPLYQTTGFTLGQHAVNAFFFISGLTLAHSLYRVPKLTSFAWARFLRIFPGLFVYGILFAFIAGPLLSSMTLLDYFTDAHTYFYPLAVLVEFSRATPPHQIFTTTAFSGAVNNPLWTIKYEVAAYAMLGGLFYLDLLHRTWVLLMIVALSLAAMFAENLSATWIYNLSRYELCFMLGVLAHRFRNRIPLDARYLLPTITIAYLLADTHIGYATNIFAVAHLVLVVGALQFGSLTTYTRKVDLSYGMYIYGWPIQQTLVAMIAGITIPMVFVLSFVFSSTVALASWNYIERPALRFKKSERFQIDQNSAPTW